MQAAARIILGTWGVLLVLYALGRRHYAERLLPHLLVVELSPVTRERARPGSLGTRVGALWVFMANIITCALVIAAPRAPRVAAFLEALRVPLFAGIPIAGALLFVGIEVWGLWALLSNPHYTPLYKPMREHFILATQGAYAWVRHPRYQAEAVLNLALFLLTGVWLPLLGVLGWWGMARQAAAEERCLLDVVGEPYRKYREQTGMFWPKRGKRR